MNADDRAPAPLTAASRNALAHYRAKATACRAEADRGPVGLVAGHRYDAARWDALADELEAFGETSDHHEGQGELL